MDEAKAYEIAGHPVTCAHCRNQTFYTRCIFLDTRRSEAIDLIFWNEETTNYICARCGHVTWFLDLLPIQGANDSTITLEKLLADEEEEAPPVTNYQAPESSVTEPTECLSCGEMIPSYQTKCPACGWSYRNEP